MKSEDFIQLRLLLGTYVTAPSNSIIIFHIVKNVKEDSISESRATTC